MRQNGAVAERSGYSEGLDCGPCGVAAFAIKSSHPGLVSSLRLTVS